MNAVAELLPAVVAERVDSPAWGQLDMVERVLARMPQVKMPLDHIFGEGFYVRSIFMPAGTVVTTRIHLTEHPFVISLGSVTLWDGENGAQRFSAPHVGVTKKGTRRLLFVHEDCIFSTFHWNPDNDTDPDKLVDKLTFDPVELGHLDDLSPEQLEAIRAVAKPQSPCHLD